MVFRVLKGPKITVFIFIRKHKVIHLIYALKLCAKGSLSVSIPSSDQHENLSLSL